MHSKFNLSVVSPCYNPASDWVQNYIENCINIENSLKDFTINFVLVNDGSKSGLTESDISLIKNRIDCFDFIEYSVNKGKGHAIREGFKNCRYDNVIFTDVDFPYENESLIKIARSLLEDKADIIIGKRSDDYYKEVPVFRKLISKILITLNKTLLNLPTGETQAGLKGFSPKGKKAVLSSTINGYLFDIEVLKLAKKSNYTISQSTVELKKDIHFRKMPYKTLVREFFNYLKIVFCV